MSEVIQGSLFSTDFLQETIRELEGWSDLDDGAVAALESRLIGIFDRFPSAQSPSESRTEDDLIWPVLADLGWESSVRQQNLSVRGRDDVPDGLLFADDVAKARASEHPEQWRAYEHGLVVVESKRWQRPLDRRSGRRGEETAPSTQMLRYLRRVDDLTSGALRWGILTNGARWRLYYQGARSVSEQFFEINLAAVLDLPGHNEGLFALAPEDRRHWLKVFAFLFGREAFLPGAADPRTVHQRALDEGRFHEERVAASLSDLVFGQVFPQLVRGIAAEAPEAPLPDVRDAALVLLYRLLFILYAEDRSLLPIRDARYDDYGLRDRVRGDVGARKDRGDVFSDKAARYWSAVDDLCRAIDAGDESIGLPPYNGGLFDRERTPLLADIRLRDDLMADVIDALSFEQAPAGRRYINYRDLSVQQLGSIYERLLEHEVVREDDAIAVRPNIFARKGSGSYYTPEDLVGLIIRETLEPLVGARLDAFHAKLAELDKAKASDERRIGKLKLEDPASKLLELKICDPAMGSGHFLVSLVDYLADQIITALADAEAAVEDYVSPLSDRIDDIRRRIMANAEERGWTVDDDQLDDRHIIRRMILKRCVYGVDKNPMAVELAKVALWLHTFTVGAPLSFLDHHLRCGDSLFGSWVRSGIDKAADQGSPLLLHGPITRATSAAANMHAIEGLTDAEIAEAHLSASIFEGVKDMTSALDRFLSLVHAFDWLDIKGKDNLVAVHAFFDGQFGDPTDIALGKIEVTNGRPEAQRFAEILAQARALIAEERFLNWQVVFPGVWKDWQSNRRVGGFDAVIGNPPWDVYEFEEVPWFAARDREIALLQSDKARKESVQKLRDGGDPLWNEYVRAIERLDLGSKFIRSERSDYKLLNSGKLNLYKLFVERAMSLVKPEGFVGLLTPSGIASDKTAAPFFKGVATEGRLKALYDFENKKVFFPDVHASFKFCVFVASPSPTPDPAKCAFYLHSVSEIDDPDRCFPLSAEDFARVNPNTGTSPIFRTRRDADLTTAIYARLPVLLNRTVAANQVWPVQFDQMLNMTTDSKLFRTREDLQEIEAAWPEGLGRWKSKSGFWVPLYEGKMVQAFDHRAADVIVVNDNLFRPGQQAAIPSEEKADPLRFPAPRYYVNLNHEWWKNEGFEWVLSFKDITATTNVRTMIAAIIPLCGAGHTLPVLNLKPGSDGSLTATIIVANLNALIFDYLARQKVQTTHFSNFILEQLPVVPPETYDTVRFGPRTAGEIVREAVLELTYTAHDMAPFARDMGYVDDAGKVRSPFVWDDDRRLHLRARLDAVYFHLYGVTDRDDVRYVHSTFPIVERQETEAFGAYRSRDLCLAYMNALAAGQPDAVIDA
ncbi:MAG: restriction endonuclease [Rhodospirillales bacterium CG15_BIG_FIL_POST_REV_8_21_14_020_66_15]|nr:MAG: restriction endonuclease [Rhodospirillales bacterium CG15_BIG_FIL_POST_REV_8_21_14_020_66_15]